MGIFKPTAMRGRVTELTPDFLSQLGARAVLLDVDNTIASYTSHEPIEGAVQWAQNMVEAGFRVMIVSNNFKTVSYTHLDVYKRQRVAFAGELSIPRKEAMQLVADAGGVNCDSVGSRTDYLVVGSTALPAKENAAPLQKGRGMAVLTEQAFFRLVRNQMCIRDR